jgi:DNA polymerase III alpha subunit
LLANSQYSLKYGLLSPEEIVQWAIVSEYNDVAIIDINSTTAGLSYCRENKKENKKSVVGSDVRNGVDRCFVVLAKNNRGFHELNALEIAT